MCLLLCLLYQCKQIICACVCVLERAKHSFFALPNPVSCSVMNKICLNQALAKRHILFKININNIWNVVETAAKVSVLIRILTTIVN